MALASSRTTQSHTNVSGATTLVATFANDFPAAARSAVFTIGGTSSRPIPLPTGCTATSQCSVTVDTTAGQSKAITVYFYPSTDGTGTAIAGGQTTATFYAHEYTDATIYIFGIVASATASLSTNVVTVGQAQVVSVNQTFYDAVGEVIQSGANTSNLMGLQWNVELSDTRRLKQYGAGVLYDGIAWEKPVTVSVAYTGGLPTVTAGTIRFAPLVQSPIGFAVQFQTDNSTPTLYEYAPGGAVPIRSFLNIGPVAGGPLVFNDNGTVYNFFGFGVKTDARTAGPPKLPAGAFAGFDHQGRTYITDPRFNGLDIYRDGKLERVIQLPATPISATGDPSGDVFVSFPTGSGIPMGSTIYEYGPTGSRSPIAQATETREVNVKCDAAGDLFATTTNSLALSTVMWPSGSFGSASPVLVPGPYGAYPLAADVDSGGGAYFLVDTGGGLKGTGPTGTISVYYVPFGSTATPTTPLVTLARSGGMSYDAIAGY